MKIASILKAIDKRTGYTVIGEVPEVLNQFDVNTDGVRNALEAFGTLSHGDIVFIAVTEPRDVHELIGRSVRMDLTDGESIMFLTKEVSVHLNDDNEERFELGGYDEEWLFRTLTHKHIAGYYPMGGKA